MVRLFFAAVLLLLFTVPTFAQDEFPRFEMAMGYANLGFPTGANGQNERHSGFAMQNGLNFVRWFGIENYTGVYGLGNNITLISNIVGAKVAARGGRAVPYAVAGFGVGYFTDERTFGSSVSSTRLGAGVDLPLNDSMALRLDFSRMGFNLDRWRSSSNFAVGIVFNILN